MLQQTFCKSILSPFYCIDADSAYFLAVVLSIDCHRGLEQTQWQSVPLAGMHLEYHSGLSVVLVCIGKFS